jgi:hypothetical protein
MKIHPSVKTATGQDMAKHTAAQSISDSQSAATQAAPHLLSCQDYGHLSWKYRLLLSRIVQEALA